MEKIKCGVLGATGVVGQNYIRLLENHPWFQVVDVAASPQSAGKKYFDAVSDKWQMNRSVPEGVRDLIVRDVADTKAIPTDVKFYFSAMEMPKRDEEAAMEFEYAKLGYPVVSNSSANRSVDDVPMLIPEINADHINIIPIQQKNRGITKGGFVAVKPNCSIQSFMTPVFALMKAGFPIEKLIITTLQAVSGAGYPGVPSLDIVDNLVPFIGGEEAKTEKEPMKIFGKIGEKGIILFDQIKIGATCTRVPISDGHMASVSIKFKEKIPTEEQILKIWADFRGVPQELDLPFAPKQPIIYQKQENRPQPKKDRDNDKGMAVTVGRLRKDPVFDVKFIGLSHNTVRGAAGGGILNAELLKAKGFIK